MSEVIRANDAQVCTASVEIRIVLVRGNKMTLSVMRQIEIEEVIPGLEQHSERVPRLPH